MITWLIFSLAWAATPPDVLKVEIEIGKQTSIYRIVPEGDAYRVHFSNNRRNQSRTLTRANFEFIQSQVDNMDEATNIIDLCPAKFIRVTTKSWSKVGCEGSPNPLAKKMNRLIDILDFLF